MVRDPSTPPQVEAEQLARAFAHTYDTPACRRAILFAEAGVLSWTEVATLFAKAYVNGVTSNEDVAGLIEKTAPIEAETEDIDG